MDRLGLLCRNIYENNKMTQRELAAPAGGQTSDILSAASPTLPAPAANAAAS